MRLDLDSLSLDEIVYTPECDQALKDYRKGLFDNYESNQILITVEQRLSESRPILSPNSGEMEPGSKDFVTLNKKLNPVRKLVGKGDGWELKCPGGYKILAVRSRMYDEYAKMLETRTTLTEKVLKLRNFIVLKLPQ